MRIEVVDHSLEVNARIGPVIFASRFGELRVELVEEVPETLFLGCVGRLIEEVVDHVALRGRGWRVIAVENPELDVGQVLVVAAGSVEYRMPWAP